MQRSRVLKNSARKSRICSPPIALITRMGKGATELALSEVETGNAPNRLFLQQKITKEAKMSSDLT